MQAKIDNLRAQVEAARQEFDLALWFYEAWKPTAFDADLHARMGTSYATNTFLTIREALRREMLLAVARLWDRNRDAVRLSLVCSLLAEVPLIKALAEERAKAYDWPGVADEMYLDLQGMANTVIGVVRKYQTGGAGAAVLENLLRERHENLAHRQVSASDAAISRATAEEIETLFQDMSEVIGTLMHVAKATGYEPDDTAELFRRHSKQFWAGVCGERTAGHPDYRPLPPPPSIATSD